MRVVVLGAGGWGTALARLLFYNGHNVSLWSRRGEHVQEMKETGENRAYLPDVLLPPDLEISHDLAVARDAELVVFAVPTAVVAEMARAAQPYIPASALLVNVAKGFVAPSLQRISQLLKEIYPENEVTVLSGPSHAEEVARDLPTTVCVAGENLAVLKTVQDVFISRTFRVYTNEDLIGVEVAGAVKNIIALGAGLADGLCQGDNAKAALITRGIAEISRLGVAMGAQPSTFSGLAGVGDLIVTCTSLHSRNYRVGREIGRGKPWRQVVEDLHMVAEGVYATKSAKQLAERYGVDMPITNQINKILYEDYPPWKAMWDLMERERTGEQ